MKRSLNSLVGLATVRQLASSPWGWAKALGLNPDLVVLTGDYICWNPQAEVEAVRALAGLRAPHGVFGCLGNHEEEGKIEESIARLFTAQGIRIPRQERAAIRLSGETLNLIGMDDP